MKTFQTQVSTHHYFKNYDSLQRFISYFFQIDFAIKSNPKSILEIGIGNKTVSDYLKRVGYEITTCDFDTNLEPDVIADIRELPFEDNAFDLVLACEVLEHIPFEDFEKALEEIKRVSKKTIIISIPYSCIFWEVILNISNPFLIKLLNFSIRLPLFFLKVIFGKNSKEHHWEMGTSGYSKRKITKIVKKHFKIKERFSPILNSYHYFFILEK